MLYQKAGILNLLPAMGQNRLIQVIRQCTLQKLPSQVLLGQQPAQTAKEKEPGTRIASRLSLVVEAGGIEPPSENTSTQVSPSAVCLLGFPSRTAGKQAMRYGIL